MLGRTFLPEEHQREPNGGVVILSGHFWRQHFNSDPAILGREITIARQSRTVIGVFASDAFSAAIRRRLSSARVWLMPGIR